jgi:plasmid replication initiation protein
MGALDQVKAKVAAKQRKDELYNPEDLPSGERWVAMSNAIVRSAQGLSLPEKQIIMLAVSKLDSRKFHGKDNLPRVRLTAAEMVEAFGLDPSNAYKHLKQAGDHLYERSLVLREQVHERVKSGRGSGEMVMRCRWIGSQKYHDGEGWMEMVFWPEIVPHLTALKARFTEYQMKQVASLRSSYSWRLLELLMQFAGSDKRNPNGTVTIEIGDFHHAMETAESQRENFAFLRRRVIEPAIKELTEKDGWLIDWKPIKAGRRVAKLQFRFAKNSQPQLPLDR